jgi:hypothetical protein
MNFKLVVPADLHQFTFGKVKVGMLSDKQSNMNITAVEVSITSPDFEIVQATVLYLTTQLVTDLVLPQKISGELLPGKFDITILMSNEDSIRVEFDMDSFWIININGESYPATTAEEIDNIWRSYRNKNG